MEEKLKPCPCCGSPLVSAWWDTVQCDECHATITGDTQEDAIQKWNSRVVTPAQVEAAAKALSGHGFGCVSGVTLADHPRALFLRREAEVRRAAIAVLRAAGFEVEVLHDLRHILTATISKIKEEA